MINEEYVKKYCRDDLSKIENYEQAIAEHRAKLAESARKRWARELSNK